MSASLILAFVSDTAKIPNATIATAIVTFSIAAKYERTCFITFPFVVKERRGRCELAISSACLLFPYNSYTIKINHKSTTKNPFKSMG